MPETIPIQPLGLYNEALRRQCIVGAKFVATGDGKMGLEFEGTTENLLSTVIDRMVVLDQIVGLVVKTNADKIASDITDIRQAFASGMLTAVETLESDDFDDLIGNIESAVRGILNSVKEANLSA